MSDGSRIRLHLISYAVLWITDQLPVLYFIYYSYNFLSQIHLRLSVLLLQSHLNVSFCCCSIWHLLITFLILICITSFHFSSFQCSPMHSFHLWSMFSFCIFSLLSFDFPHFVDEHVNCPIISLILLWISVCSIMFILSISSHFLLSHSLFTCLLFYLYNVIYSVPGNDIFISFS